MSTIISNKYKYIFIHIPKNAGMFITGYLNNFENKPVTIKYFNKIINICGIKKNLYFVNEEIFKNRYLLFSNHERAREIKNKIGNLSYSNYFKFAFVRNPWERCVSRYNYFKLVSNKKIKFYDFLNIDFQPQKKRIENEQGKIIIDFIGRYENLYDDLKYILDKTKIPFIKDKIKVVNQSKKINDFREYYDEKTYNLVKQKYKEDINFFSYKFDTK